MERRLSEQALIALGFTMTLNQRVQGSNPCAPTKFLQPVHRLTRRWVYYGRASFDCRFHPGSTVRPLALLQHERDAAVRLTRALAPITASQPAPAMTVSLKRAPRGIWTGAPTPVPGRFRSAGFPLLRTCQAPAYPFAHSITPWQRLVDASLKPEARRQFSLPLPAVSLGPGQSRLDEFPQSEVALPVGFRRFPDWVLSKIGSFVG
jgi:hypothetical protein